MYKEISYSEAVKRYPDLVAEIAALKAKSRSKLKHTPLSALKFGFNWGVRCSMTSSNDFMQVLTGQKRPAKPRKLTENETVADYERNAIICLRAANWRSTSLIKKLPKEIEADVRKSYRDEKTEALRFKKLTTNQKNKELNDALTQLRKGSGFMEVHLL